MGIRFYCPNGHKLNVKEFQAGLKGICPYCGVKIKIPTESTRPASKVKKEPPGDVPDAQQAPPADPLVEAGDAVWYVRPPGGGQFGPAGPDVMKTWIAEGRVSPDCLVWREGWRDWREASHVFPTLAAGGAESSPAMVIATERSPCSTTATGRPRSGRRRKSKRSQAVVIILLISAVLILSIVLIGVLTK